MKPQQGLITHLLDHLKLQTPATVSDCEYIEESGWSTLLVEIQNGATTLETAWSLFES
jgi:hypothetical protein